jgi:hypothetical protein
LTRGRRDVVTRHGNYVQRLGQQSWKIHVFRVHANALTSTSIDPPRRWHRRLVTLTANRQSQVYSQTVHSHTFIFVLTAPFRRLGLGTGGTVDKHNCRLNFVAMLPAGSRSSTPPSFAILQ